MSLKNAANEIFKDWATPAEIQEFGRRLVAELQELGFRDRTIDTLPFNSTVTQELVNSGEDNIYHWAHSPHGGGMLLCSTAYQISGGGNIPPRLIFIGLDAGRTVAIGIAYPETGHPTKSFQWKDREKAEKEIVEWLAENAGNDVRAKLGWTDAQNAIFKPRP